MKPKAREHSDQCHSEDLTGYPAPCNCGADDFNAAIDKVEEHYNYLMTTPEVACSPSNREALSELARLAYAGAVVK